MMQLNVSSLRSAKGLSSCRLTGKESPSEGSLRNDQSIRNRVIRLGMKSRALSNEAHLNRLVRSAQLKPRLHLLQRRAMWCDDTTLSFRQVLISQDYLFHLRSSRNPGQALRDFGRAVRCRCRIVPNQLFQSNSRDWVDKSSSLICFPSDDFPRSPRKRSEACEIPD